MKRQLIVCVATILAFCSSTFADPAAVVKAHSDAFGAAFNSCDVPAALKLYEKNAVLIWPGDGEVAKGKAEIAKINTNVRPLRNNYWYW
jgi:ketosteroid isomerase-like protein